MMEIHTRRLFICSCWLTALARSLRGGVLHADTQPKRHTRVETNLSSGRVTTPRVFLVVGVRVDKSETPTSSMEKAVGSERMISVAALRMVYKLEFRLLRNIQLLCYQCFSVS